MTAAGRVIVITGGSSSGKTTIGRKLQESLGGDWLLLGVDLLLWMMPPALMRNSEGLAAHRGVITRGPRFMPLFAAFRSAVASIAANGVDVIVDEVMLEGAVDQGLWLESLAGLDVLWVGVRCDPDVVAARESARGDRPPGIARHQAMTVHEGVRYDIEVDTGVLDTARAVDVVAGAAHDRWGIESAVATNDAPALPVKSALAIDDTITRAPWES